MNVWGKAPQMSMATGARLFALISVSAAAGWRGDRQVLGGLVALSVIWLVCSVLEHAHLPRVAMTAVESSLVAVVAGLYLEQSPSLMAALAVPPFVHALARGLRGTVESLIFEVLVIGALLVFMPLPPADHVADMFTWLLAGLGIGLVANFFARPSTEDTVALAYRDARRLLRDLNDLASQLDGGLDATSMGGALLDEVAADLPLASVVLHVQRNEELYPLVERSNRASTSSALVRHPNEDEAGLSPAAALAAEVWAQGRSIVTGTRFGFALRSGDTPIAVVTGERPDPPQFLAEDLIPRLDSLSERLAPLALKLDTAQLFSAFRDRAMREERLRLSREMHDGMAQDIASMGYVVDALISTATPLQEQALVQLRSMITRVVAEVRRSVMTLRTDAGSSESLGAAVATLARHLSETSGTPIQVTIDERTDRLRHEVESELLRIAQEAMNNGVKHSGASAIDVQCRVQAPHALIVVQDDGHGLRPGRSDSHGLVIMRERAALVGAHLDVTSSPGAGTRVSVRIGPAHVFASTPPHSQEAP